MVTNHVNARNAIGYNGKFLLHIFYHSKKDKKKNSTAANRLNYIAFLISLFLTILYANIFSPLFCFI